ncbi:hypothetical protein PYW07_009398 [Mythimna separata]|uniref:Venom serine protease 34 n=1 Tax=Mythimna separata TaxID=271217 RepID=A0AAD8DN93_MYTSE|nr:hypothetical protein PYW07_009398 [Mythimna separata]
MNFRLVLLLWLLNYTSAQDANCDFYQAIPAGSTRYIFSPNYEGSYTPGSTCRWIVDCPAGYNCRLDCPEIILPQTTSCSLDRLLVSRSGDPQLNNAEKYCGSGSLSNIVSTAQRISIGLITSRDSPGGRFKCTVTTQVATPPTPSCVCGIRRQNRIVGGQETGVNEFTMMAALVDVRITQIKCGGAIITPRHVLSAAHCVANQSVNNYAVLVGEHDITTGNDTPAQAAYVISLFTIHPNYNPNTYDNDISIVTTAINMAFSDRVGPACLPFLQTSNSFAGSKVTVVGWGTTFFGGPTSNVPLKADLDVITQTACRSTGAQITDRQMCTYTSGKDSCQDDSGGSLWWTNPSNGLLYSVGVISSGSSCASKSPAINTRITPFLDWIRANTQNYNYCRI